MLSGQNVYAGPDASNYFKVGSVDAGEQVYLLGQQAGWYHIQYMVKGLTISDEQMEIFDITAKKMYETSDKAMSEDEYVNKWMRIQINEEMEFKYKDIILSKIAEGTFVPEDEITREKLEIFNNNKNVSNLDDIYDSHINFLAKNYLIH